MREEGREREREEKRESERRREGGEKEGGGNMDPRVGVTQLWRPRRL